MNLFDELEEALENARESVDLARETYAGHALEDLLGVVEVIVDIIRADAWHPLTAAEQFEVFGREVLP